MENLEEQLRAIWNQGAVPVVLRRGGRKQRLRIRLPFAKLNGLWLQNGQRTSPQWLEEKKCWEVPKAWFNKFVARALEKYGQLYIIQPYREQEKCAPACFNATGHECQCSCMGRYHGAGSNGSWFEVSDTFATRWGEQILACRLMVRK